MLQTDTGSEWSYRSLHAPWVHAVTSIGTFKLALHFAQGKSDFRPVVTLNIYSFVTNERFRVDVNCQTSRDSFTEIISAEISWLKRASADWQAVISPQLSGGASLVNPPRLTVPRHVCPNLAGTRHVLHGCWSPADSNLCCLHLRIAVTARFTWPWQGGESQTSSCDPRPVCDVYDGCLHHGLAV